jgi:hypothetical protein
MAFQSRKVYSDELPYLIFLAFASGVFLWETQIYAVCLCQDDP